MRNRNQGSRNSRRGTKDQGLSAWRGRGWSPVRKNIKGNFNFRAVQGWGGCADPIGYKNMNRQWIQEDQKDQIKEMY